MVLVVGVVDVVGGVVTLRCCCWLSSLGSVVSAVFIVLIACVVAVSC